MIIVLNGPINSGKSTLAKLLDQKISNSSIVEVDEIRKGVQIDDDSAWEVSYAQALDVTDEHVKSGKHVIFVYHVTKNDFELMTDRFKTDIYAFTLKPTKETLLTDRGTRPLNQYLTDKIERTYDLPEYSGEYGTVIDNTNQSPEETAQIILDKIIAI